MSYGYDKDMSKYIHFLARNNFQVILAGSIWLPADI